MQEFDTRWDEVLLSMTKIPSDDNKNAVAFLKDVRQLGCVFQDTEPQESLSILRKGPKVLGHIRRTIHKRYAASRRHPRKQTCVAR